MFTYKQTNLGDVPESDDHKATRLQLIKEADARGIAAGQTAFDNLKYGNYVGGVDPNTLQYAFDAAYDHAFNAHLESRKYEIMSSHQGWNVDSFTVLKSHRVQDHANQAYQQNIQQSGEIEKQKQEDAARAAADAISMHTVDETFLSKYGLYLALGAAGIVAFVVLKKKGQ